MAGKKKGPAPTPLAVRFWAKVQKCDGDGCWEWLGCRHSRYGVILEGEGGSRRLLQAHHVAWRLCRDEPLIKGNRVMHRCDNPGCVRPDHLLQGTAKDNTRDMIEKGRARFHFGVNPPRGESNAWAKFTDEQVRQIREDLKRGMKPTDIARSYGVTKETIYGIKRGKAWRHV